MKTKMKESAKKWVIRLLGRFKWKLPEGVEALKIFQDRIFYAYGLPDHPTYRHAIATMVMHLPPTQDRQTLVFFARSIRKAMANQIAYNEMQKINAAQKAQEIADKLSALQEAPQAV